jgi:hypothetical protein
MGCHTWFKKPTNKKIEDLKKIAKEHIKQFEPHYKAIGAQNQYRGTLRWITRGSCNVINDLVSHYGYEIIDNKVYQDLSFEGIPEKEFEHDAFRVSGYPDIILKSYKQTLKWIEKNKEKNHISIDKNGNKRLKKFWEKYPKGLITFG